MKLEEFYKKHQWADLFGKKVKILCFPGKSEDLIEGQMDTIWDQGITLDQYTPYRFQIPFDSILDIEIVEVQND